MRHLLFIAAGFFGFAAHSFGQGEVIFANSVKSLVYTNSFPGGAATGLTATNANSFYYALFVAPASITSVANVAFNDANWTFTGDYATNAALAGHLYGNTTANETSVVPGYAPGASASFTVVGWSANIGSTLADLKAWYANPAVPGWIGQSAVATNLIGGGGIYAPPAIFYPIGTTTLGEIDGFTFNLIAAVPAPEPSTPALIVCATAMFAWLRRRRK
jgi:hypothetical protein